MTRQLNDGRLVDSLGSARRDAAHISTLTISYPSLSLFLGEKQSLRPRRPATAESSLSRIFLEDPPTGFPASSHPSTTRHRLRCRMAPVCVSLSHRKRKKSKKKRRQQEDWAKKLLCCETCPVAIETGGGWSLPTVTRGRAVHTERRKPLTRQRRPHLSNKQNGTLPVAGRGVWLQVEIVENVFNFFDDVVVVVFVLTAAQFERWMGRFGSERRNWRGRRSCRLLSRLGRRGMADSAGAAPIPLDRPRSGHLLFYLVISIL